LGKRLSIFALQI